MVEEKDALLKDVQKVLKVRLKRVDDLGDLQDAPSRHAPDVLKVRRINVKHMVEEKDAL